MVRNENLSTTSIQSLKIFWYSIKNVKYFEDMFWYIYHVLLVNQSAWTLFGEVTYHLSAPVILDGIITLLLCPCSLGLLYFFLDLSDFEREKKNCLHAFFCVLFLADFYSLFFFYYFILTNTTVHDFIFYFLTFLFRSCV